MPSSASLRHAQRAKSSQSPRRRVSERAGGCQTCRSSNNSRSRTYSQAWSHATMSSSDRTRTELTPWKYAANGRSEPRPNARSGTRIATRSHADSRPTRRAARRMTEERSRRNDHLDDAAGMEDLDDDSSAIVLASFSAIGYANHA